MKLLIGAGALLFLLGFFAVIGAVVSPANTSGGRGPQNAATTESPKTSEPSPETPAGILRRPTAKADIEVTAEAMDKEFRENRIAFDRKYKNKTVAVRGSVGRIEEEDSTSAIYIRGTGTLLGTDLVPCTLRPSDSELAEQLSSGDDVLVVGQCVEPEERMMSDNIRIVDCVIGEMPKKSPASFQASRDASQPSVLTLKELVTQLKDNEPRTMKQYRDKRILLEAKWDSVQQSDDGLPELHLLSFSPACAATCTLRRDQMDAASVVDLSRPVLVDAIFGGGDGNWTPFKFRDGVLNPDKNKRNAAPSSSSAESAPATSSDEKNGIPESTKAPVNLGYGTVAPSPSDAAETESLTPDTLVGTVWKWDGPANRLLFLNIESKQKGKLSLEDDPENPVILDVALNFKGDEFTATFVDKNGESNKETFRITGNHLTDASGGVWNRSDERD